MRHLLPQAGEGDNFAGGKLLPGKRGNPCCGGAALWTTEKHHQLDFRVDDRIVSKYD
jgi:hypothetical protein